MSTSLKLKEKMFSEEIGGFGKIRSPERSFNCSIKIDRSELTPNLVDKQIKDKFKMSQNRIFDDQGPSDSSNQKGPSLEESTSSIVSDIITSSDGEAKGGKLINNEEASASSKAI